MNITELRARLERSKLHPSEYYVLRPVTADGYYIARLKDGWEVGLSTGGGWPPRESKVFSDESDACEYLWNLIVADGRA